MRQIIIARHFTENIFRIRRWFFKFFSITSKRNLLRVRPRTQMSSAFIFSFIARCCEAVLSGQQRDRFQLFLDSELGTMLYPAGWNGPLIRRVLTKICFEISQAVAVPD